MEFREWEPVYEAVLADMGYDRVGDERARDLLASLVGDGATEDGTGAGTTGSNPDGDDGPLTPAALDFAGETVAVAGGAPSLDAADDRVGEADSVVAASDAAGRLREAGVAVDCLVTDLDGEPDVATELTREGTPVAVHAHGDNRPALRERVPEMAVDAVMPTTQAAPAGPVCNAGGFTDGDRAAFLADHCGAARLTFPGWDFDDPTVGEAKRRKLRWAERLLRWLERRRGERFPVLDGRRDDVDESALPGGD